MTRKQKRRIEKRRRHGRVCLGAAAAIGAAGAVAGQAQAADYMVLNTGDAGADTLRAAINSANATGVGDRILFQAGLTGDINLNTSLPQITSPLEIVGPGTALAIDGQGSYRPLSVDEDFKISGITLKDGYGVYCNPCVGTTNGGGGMSILDNNDVTVDSVIFDENVAGGSLGGAIYLGAVSDLTVTNSTFTGNQSGDEGGAIYAKGVPYSQTKLAITNSTFFENGAGLPIYNKSGGAVAVSALGRSEVTITGAAFMSNRAGTGGAVFSGYQDHLTVDDSTFSGNTASYTGGAASMYGQFTITGSEFTANESDYAGGAVSGSPNAGASSITGSTISGNTAGGDGGGLNFSGASRIRVRNSTVAGNSAKNGGGGIYSTSESLEMDSITVSGNTLTPSYVNNPTFGGGIAQRGGAAEVSNSIVSGNTATTGPDLGAIPGAPGETPGSFAASFNLIGNAAGAPVTDIVTGSNLSGVNPQLGALADNGGPTKTMLPATTSPAINKGGSNLTVDQRGLKRPVDYASIPFSSAIGGNGADMGAVELQYTKPPDPPPPDPPSNAFTFGKVTLNKKIGSATLKVKVPGAGKVVLAASKSIGGQTKTAAAAATVGLTVKAKGKTAKTLKKKGKATVKASVTFTPTGGTAKSATRSVKLIRKKAKKK